MPGANMRIKEDTHEIYTDIQRWFNMPKNKIPLAYLQLGGIAMDRIVKREDTYEF